MKMYRILLNKGTILSALPAFSLLNEKDEVKPSKTTESADYSAVKSQTGYERLVHMFTIDEYEAISPELVSIMQLSSLSVVVGGFYGGFVQSRTAYMDFIQNNQASMFRSHLEAKQKLQDKITLSFGKGFFRWGWRTSLFTVSYMGVAKMISVYRGKYGIIEYSIGGTFAGVLYKFFAGPRGWIVGGGLGGVLCTIYGAMQYGVFKLTGGSMERVHYWQYKWREARRGGFKQALRERNNSDLLLLHDKKNNIVDGLDGLSVSDTSEKQNQ